MAQTDAQYRNTSLNHTADGLKSIVSGRSRIARTVGNEHTIRLQVQDVLGRRTAGDNFDPGSSSSQTPENIGFDPIIQNDDTRPCGVA